MLYATKMMIDLSPGDDNPVCGKCGLYRTCRKPFMDAEVPDNGASILVIGEAPGEDEDAQGRPFVGRSGNLLRTALREVGCDSVAYTNIVRCRPPDNKIAVKYIQACAKFALQDIERLQPSTVLLMGNSPLNGILGESGITNWHGVEVKKDGRRYIPLYHPAYILRNMSMQDEWLEAILSAVDGDGDNKSKFERIIPRTLDDVRAMEDRLAGSEFVAYDTEVYSLDPYHERNKILSVSFAIDGYSWALPINHQQSWWSLERYRRGKLLSMTEREQVIATVQNVLRTHNGFIYAHNLKFDQVQTNAQLGMWFAAGGDTMLLSHLLDSRQGIHGLKRLAGINLGMYEYEAELTAYKRMHPEADPERGGTYDNIPLDILLPYGAMDAEAVWLLHPLFYSKLSKKQRTLYNQLLLGASDALAYMQNTGMPIDSGLAYRYQAIYAIRQRELFEEILDDPKVKRMTADLKAADPKKYKKYIFNPASFQQKGWLYYDYYKIPPKLVPTTDSGSASTSSKALKPLEDKWPILKLIRYYNLLNKMLGTYLTPAASGAWLSGDGLARTTFNLHGTISGRLSSSKPFNSQNIPTKEKEPDTILAKLPIKNIFTHHFVRWDELDFVLRYGDGVILAFDYSGMELRVFASLANCEPMLAIHRSGRDFHSMVAVLSTMRKAIEDITDVDIASIAKPVRYRYKWTNWTLLYGGDANTLHRLYGIDRDEAQETVDTYYATFPQVPEYMETCIRFAEEHGYIESPFGRRVHLPYINDDRDRGKRAKSQREAVNVPVQSGASDTLLCALVVVDRVIQEQGLRSRLINTVHDSMALSVPNDEIHHVAATVIDIMENIAVYAKTYLPGISFDWLKSPLKADAEIGTHYGAMIDYEDWKSGKQSYM